MTKSAPLQEQDLIKDIIQQQNHPTTITHPHQIIKQLEKDYNIITNIKTVMKVIKQLEKEL